MYSLVVICVYSFGVALTFETLLICGGIKVAAFLEDVGLLTELVSTVAFMFTRFGLARGVIDTCFGLCWIAATDFAF